MTFNTKALAKKRKALAAEASAEKRKERLIPVAEVATMIGVGVRTVWKMNSMGELPAPVKLSSRVTRWKLSQIEAFIENIQPAA